MTMRLAIGLLAFLCLSNTTSYALAANIRPPLMAVAFNSGEDNRKWVSEVRESSHARILMEMVPERKSFESPIEMLENQIEFTPATLNNYMKIWVLQQSQMDNGFKIINAMRDQHSILIIYRLPSQNRVVVRKFMKADDGVYMLAYKVKEDAINYDVYNIWLDTIKTSSLIKNPERLK